MLRFRPSSKGHRPSAALFSFACFFLFFAIPFVSKSPSPCSHLHPDTPTSLVFSGFFPQSITVSSFSHLSLPYLPAHSAHPFLPLVVLLVSPPPGAGTPIGAPSSSATTTLPDRGFWTPAMSTHSCPTVSYSVSFLPPIALRDPFPLLGDTFSPPYPSVVPWSSRPLPISGFIPILH